MLESATNAVRPLCFQHWGRLLCVQIAELGRARLRGLVNLHEGEGT